MWLFKVVVSVCVASVGLSAWAQDKAFVRGGVAYVEPADAVVASAYASQSPKLSLALGQELDQVNRAILQWHHRSYDSDLENFPARLSLSGVAAGFEHDLVALANGWRLTLAAAVGALYLTTQGPEAAKEPLLDRLSFGYNLGFGCGYSYAGYNVQAKVEQEHIFRRFLGNYSFDGHLYELAFTALL